MILKCSCPHPYQDEKYGEGRRVVNPKLAKSAFLSGVCTACGNEIFTNRKQPAQAKTGSGHGKKRYWFEAPEVTRRRFAKQTGGLYR